MLPAHNIYGASCRKLRNLVSWACRDGSCSPDRQLRSDAAGASLECVRPASARYLAPSAQYANFSLTAAFEPSRSRRKRDSNRSNFED